MAVRSGSKATFRAGLMKFLAGDPQLEGRARARPRGNGKNKKNKRSRGIERNITKDIRARARRAKRAKGVGHYHLN